MDGSDRFVSQSGLNEPTIPGGNMKTITNLRRDVQSGRFTTAMAAFAFAALFLVMPESAMAQSNPTSNPFTNAEDAAQDVVRSLTTFALAVGGIGMISCLLLGFFGKLNWKGVATGIGVSFGIAIVPTAIGWLNSLGAA